MHDLIVRAAVAQEAQIAADIDAAAFAENGTTEEPSVIVARQRVYPTGFLVANLDHHVVGYVSSERWQAIRTPAMNEIPEVSHDPVGTVLCITAMAVLPAWQNNGIGTVLLAAIVAHARLCGCKQIVLETVRAAPWYRKHGFLETGRREQMGANLIVLARQLP